MEAIKFKLSGRTGFFKKPDVNANTYFTYNHIHKISLLGLLGAILGLEGHIQQERKIREQKEEQQYPEFYDKLQSLKVSIVPHGDRGYFTKKIQEFNNSVGYANEDGGTLIVKEQWLENPSWTIYLLNDGSISSELFSKLQSYLLNKQAVYFPYLGKNDHPATIEKVEIVQLSPIDRIEGIHSLFYAEEVEFKSRGTFDGENVHYYKEFLPVSLHAEHNYYEFNQVAFTNRKVKSVKDSKRLYVDNDQTLYFI